MGTTPPFEMQTGHKFYSAFCFSKTWDFIDRPVRTEQENLSMLHSCLASLWHWSQRDDVTPKHRSIGYWQASRVFALLGKADDARTYGQLSLDNSGELEPFYVGYAYEALARSEQVAGDTSRMEEYLKAAREQCEKVTDTDSRKQLEEDLKTIG
jgi:hypothetical protein